MIKRRPNWETIFEEFLYSRLKYMFDRGSSDCVPFCADGIKLYTGVDLAENFRGLYNSDKEAFRLIKNHPEGFFGIVKDEMEKFDLTIKNRKLAKRGDLVFLEYDNQEGLGLCNGRLAATPGTDSLNWVDMTCAKAVWGIPFA